MQKSRFEPDRGTSDSSTTKDEHEKKEWPGVERTEKEIRVNMSFKDSRFYWLDIHESCPSTHARGKLGFFLSE
jgi:hypothetical protein